MCLVEKGLAHLATSATADCAGAPPLTASMSVAAVGPYLVGVCLCIAVV